MIFADRDEAGKKLGTKLLRYPLIQQAAKDELMVLSIPRGGVVVGAVIAQMLECVHEVVVAKKISFPGYSEAAIGAMAEDGPATLDPQLLDSLLQQKDYLKQQKARTKAQIETYIQKFRAGRRLDLQSKIVIVVDDGIATGETMKAAILWLKSKDQADRPRKILVAVPVCSLKAAKEFTKLVDQFISLSIPRYFWAVGQFYRDFGQVSDEEVISLLSRWRCQDSQKTEANISSSHLEAPTA